MSEDIKKLVTTFTDPDMTRESRASVLGYARGRLDAQKELRANTGSSLAEEKSQTEGGIPSANKA